MKPRTIVLEHFALGRSIAMTQGVQQTSQRNRRFGHESNLARCQAARAQGQNAGMPSAPSARPIEHMNHIMVRPVRRHNPQSTNLIPAVPRIVFRGSITPVSSQRKRIVTRHGCHEKYRQPGCHAPPPPPDRVNQQRQQIDRSAIIITEKASRQPGALDAIEI